MSLYNQFNLDIKNALVQKDNNSKLVLKSVKNKAANIAKDNHCDISDDIMIKAIKKEIKELTQTIDTASKDSELYANSVIQKEILSKYLPKELSEDELKSKIQEVLSDLPTDANVGLKMKTCIAKLGSVADGKTIKRIIDTL